MKKLQEIELIIKNEDDGVYAISLVDSPAIQENFIMLSSQNVELKILDEEKRIVVGFALVPEKRIYRKYKEKEFNVFFTKETVAKSQELFMKNLNINKFTTEHREEVNGVNVIESWIVEDPKNDKSNLYKLKPKGGEWVVMSKIYNDDVWNEVKNGTFKGYSIEGLYDGFDKLEASEQECETTTMIKEFLKSI
jgi:hypothetical protein